jgi:ribonuclease Z
MRTLFHPTLLFPPTGDPGAWIDLPDEGRAVLLDLPSLAPLPPRRLLKLAHAVVTHTHMDHFIGFDQLLRVALRREEPLAITGPPGFLASVRGRIAAYSWNLIEGYPVCLRVQEVGDDTLRVEEYSGASRMRPVRLPDAPFTGTVHAERAFRVEVAMLDHGIPVLGIALRETRHLGVNKDLLRRRGLVPGAWLKELKDAIRRGETVNTDGLIVEGNGQVVAYLTDLAGTDENLKHAEDLVRGADLLICEAAFLDEDRALALERNHLTARQAGTLARRAGAKRLAVFHMSPRYEGREGEILGEAGEAFGAPVLEMRSLSPIIRP